MSGRKRYDALEWTNMTSIFARTRSWTYMSLKELGAEAADQNHQHTTRGGFEPMRVPKQRSDFPKFSVTAFRTSRYAFIICRREKERKGKERTTMTGWSRLNILCKGNSTSSDVPRLVFRPRKELWNISPQYYDHTAIQYSSVVQYHETVQSISHYDDKCSCCRRRSCRCILR